MHKNWEEKTSLFSTCWHEYKYGALSDRLNEFIVDRAMLINMLRRHPASQFPRQLEKSFGTQYDKIF